MLLPYLLALLLGASAPDSIPDAGFSIAQFPVTRAHSLGRDSLMKAVLASPTTPIIMKSTMSDRLVANPDHGVAWSWGSSNGCQSFALSGAWSSAHTIVGYPQTIDQTASDRLFQSMDGTSPPIPDYYRYRDTKRHLWVTIVPQTSIMAKNGSWLIHDYLNSEVAEFIQHPPAGLDTSGDIGDLQQTYLRYEQRDNGTVVSGLRLTTVDQSRLEHLNDVWRGKAPPPPPLPRKLFRADIRTLPVGPSFNGRLPMRARDLTSDATCALIAGPAGSDVVVSVRSKKWHSYNVDWAFYTTFLDGDTLTVNMLGRDTEKALQRLGYSDNDPYELMVTIERYVVDRHGRKLMGPIFIGPMTKARFDRRHVTPIHARNIDGGIPLPSLHL